MVDFSLMNTSAGATLRSSHRVDRLRRFRITKCRREMRIDVLRAARCWREADEQIELLYGNRRRQFSPLSDGARGRYSAGGHRLRGGNDRPGARRLLALALPIFRPEAGAKAASR